MSRKEEIELKTALIDYTLKQSWTREQLEEALDEATILGHAERMDFDELWGIKLEVERSTDCFLYPIGYDPFLHDGFYRILKILEGNAATGITSAELKEDNQELYRLGVVSKTLDEVIKAYKEYRKNHK